MRISARFGVFVIAMCLFTAAGLLLPQPAPAKRGISVGAVRPTDSERRVALVIGNSRYQDNPLRNPANDARAMSRALSGLGFEVIEGEDLTKPEMEKAIIDFARKLRGSGVGLFYYAGHGVQLNGRNYLIPIGAQIPSQAFVRVAAVDLDWVNAAITDARNRLNIIILDACRDNPLPRGVRSGGKGLAVTPAPKGTLIAYATAPGSTAADGSGRNGLYTSQLLKYMQTPGLAVERVFKRVRQSVDRLSGGRQIPWEHSSIMGDFFFKPAKAGQPVRLAGGPGATPEVKPTPPPPAPPKAPGTDDLAALEEKAKRKAAWDAWQKRMGAYWGKLEKLDASSLSAKDKAQSWRGALSKFPDDNPFSSEDESLRNRARERASFWKKEAQSAPGVHKVAESPKDSGKIWKKIIEKNIWVLSKKPWTDTGISLEIGDKLVISAKGSVKFGDPAPSNTTGPDGTRLKPACHYVSDWAGTHALIGNISRSNPNRNLDGNGFTVGSSFSGLVPLSHTSDRTGRFYLGFNDGGIVCRKGKRVKIDGWGFSGDNAGGFEARVRVYRAEKGSPAPRKPLPAGRSITNSIGMMFVRIPAGSFMMGSKFSPEETAKRYGGKAKYFTDERPRHRVTISRSFYMQTTEVTQAQWTAVMDTTPWSGKKYVKSNCPSCPAVYVSWNDARKFIRKLNQKEGGSRYRLPTEAEWEYAARAGGTGAYCFGDTKGQLGEYAWYRDNASNAGQKYAHAVGGKKPNRWGLYDMHGNVLEWVQDWFEKGHYSSSPGTDPRGPGSGADRVFRGGCWLGSARSCRSAVRDGFEPGYAFDALGFRVARDAP